MREIWLGHLDPPCPQLYNDKPNSVQREERRGEAGNYVPFPQADSWQTEEGFPFPFPWMTIIGQFWSPTEGLIPHSPPLPLRPCVWNRICLCSSVLARNSIFPCPPECWDSICALPNPYGWSWSRGTFSKVSFGTQEWPFVLWGSSQVPLLQSSLYSGNLGPLSRETFHQTLDSIETWFKLKLMLLQRDSQGSSWQCILYQHEKASSQTWLYVLDDNWQTF